MSLKNEKRIEGKDLKSIKTNEVVYSGVPTPQEVELTNQLVVLRREKEKIEERLVFITKEFENKLHESEIRINELNQRLLSTRREQTKSQNEAVLHEREIMTKKLEILQAELDKEQQEKKAQQVWKQRFEENAEGGFIKTNEAEKSFSQFCQSIALFDGSLGLQVARSGVLSFLTQLLRESRNDLIIGPAILALSHLAIRDDEIHEQELKEKDQIDKDPINVKKDNTDKKDTNSIIRFNIKDEAIKAGVLPPLIHLCNWVNNSAVLIEIGKLFSTLGLHPSNKPIIAAKNGVRALIRLINGINDASVQEASIHPSVQSSILKALINLSYDSDIIRSQIVSSGVLPSIVQLIKETNDIDVKINAIQLLGNLCINSLSNVGIIISCEGDFEVIKSFHFPLLNNDLIYAILITLSNLSQTEMSQATIGYSDIPNRLVELLNTSTHSHLLMASCLCLASLMYMNPLNKTRFADLNVAASLLLLLNQPKRYHYDQKVIVGACKALATFSIMDGNRRIVQEMEGEHVVIEICNESMNETILEACGQAIVSFVPEENVKVNIIEEGKVFQIEQAGALKSLEKVAFSVYIKHSRPLPSSLEKAIYILKTSFNELKNKCYLIQLQKKEEVDIKITNLHEVFSRRDLLIEFKHHPQIDHLCKTTKKNTIS